MSQIEIEYVPESTKGKGANFSGHLTLKKPSTPQVLMGAKLAGDDASGDIEKLEKLLEWSKDFYSKVELKNEGCGTEYKSFDDLMADGECLEVLQEVATKLITGLSKKKPAKMS